MPTLNQIRRLQRTAGNAAVSRLLSAAARPLATPPRLRRVPRETPTQIESRQPWSQYQIGAPLGPVTESVAVRANAQLAFSPTKISRLLVAVGLPHRPAVLERRLVEALRRFLAAPSAEQTAEVQVATAPGSPGAAAGEDPAAIQAGAVPRSGILDEPTIFQLDIGTSWGLAQHATAARRYYRDRPPWRTMPAEQFAAVRNALREPLGISADDIRQASGRVEVTDRFVAQAINWQMWHLRSEEPTAWGRLGVSSLAAMGAPVTAPAPEAPAAAEVATTSAPQPIPHGEEPSAADEEAEERDEHGLTTSQRVALEGFAEELDALLRRWPRRARGETRESVAARAAPLGREMERRMEQIRREIDAMGLPSTDLGRVFQYVRMDIRARNLGTEIRILLGQETRRAEPPPSASAEPSPLERRDLQESMERALKKQPSIAATGRDE